MVNSNPETVSTDYDTSDRLYFEPLTFEDVLNIIEAEKPEGVIVQFGGQTPLNLSVPLDAVGVPILGTSPDAIDRAEDRERFQKLLHKLDLRQPPNGIAVNTEEALEIAARIGYPVVVRPSYVLGGRAMEIVYDEKDLGRYMSEAVQASPEHPVLIDKYLKNAIEIDVDAVADGEDCLIAGIMEHIEEAGVHSGDSACALPPFSLSAELIEEIKASTRALARELGVIGLMNIQYAVQGPDRALHHRGQPPRLAARCPLSPRPPACPWAKVATQGDDGRKACKRQGAWKKAPRPRYVSVKESVFPFATGSRGWMCISGAGDEVHRRGHGHCRRLRRWPLPRASWPPGMMAARVRQRFHFGSSDRGQGRRRSPGPEAFSSMGFQICSPRAAPAERLARKTA